MNYLKLNILQFLFLASSISLLASEPKSRTISLNVGPIIALVDTGLMYETRVLPFVWADAEAAFRLTGREKIDEQNSQIVNNTYKLITCLKYRPSDSLYGMYFSLCPAFFHDTFVIRNSLYTTQNQYAFNGFAGGSGIGYSVTDDFLFLNMGLQILFSAQRNFAYEFPEAGYRNNYSFDSAVRLRLILTAGYAF